MKNGVLKKYLPTLITVLYVVLPDLVPGPVDDALVALILSLVQFVLNKKKNWGEQKKQCIDVETLVPNSNQNSLCQSSQSNNPSYEKSPGIKAMTSFK